MPVKSLFELATSVCVKNIKQLDSIGDYLPYTAVSNILGKVESAVQLRQIELNSPQIEGETGELWLKLIERDFPLEVRSQSYKPQDPKKWYRVWEKYKKAHDRSIAEGENKLKEALAGLRQDKEKNTSKVVETKDLLNGGLVRRRARAPGRQLFGRSPAAPPTKNLLQKARREAQEIARIHGSAIRPAQVRGQTARVSKAPSAMVDDYRRAAQPTYRHVPAEAEAEHYSAVVEHEKRATFISDSEDDDDNGGLSHRSGEVALPTSRSKPRRQLTRAPASDIARKQSSKATLSSPIRKKPTTLSDASVALSRANKDPPAAALSPRPKPSKSDTSVSRRGSGILSNRYKPAESKTKIARPASISTAAAPARPHPRQSDEAPRPQPLKSTHALPRTQTSPPLTASAGPSSPPPPHSLGDASDAQPRKRRAVDIFMRPKKKLK